MTRPPQDRSNIEGFLLASLLVIASCGGAATGARPLPAPPAPIASTQAAAPSSTAAPAATGQSDDALADARAVLDRYEADAEPRAVGAGFGEMMVAVGNWVALAGKDPRAKMELEARRTRLEQEMVADPANVSTQKVSIYVEICRQTGSEREAMAALRAISSKQPAATQVRARLISLLLPWMHEQGLYSDIAVNQDVIEDHLASTLRTTKTIVARERQDATALYEALLANTKQVEAQALSERILELGAECATLRALVVAAEHQRVTAEAERLRKKMKQHAGCPVTKEEPPRTP